MPTPVTPLAATQEIVEVLCGEHLDLGQRKVRTLLALSGLRALHDGLTLRSRLLMTLHVAQTTAGSGEPLQRFLHAVREHMAGRELDQQGARFHLNQRLLEHGMHVTDGWDLRPAPGVVDPDRKEIGGRT